MQYVCDAPGRKAWFRIETEGEAARESEEMRHSLDYFFRHERDAARKRYSPAGNVSFIERDIGLSSHLKRTMPIFLTLRESDGTAVASAILPQDPESESIAARVIGPGDCDAFRAQREALVALEQHLGKPLRRQCYIGGEMCIA